MNKRSLISSRLLPMVAATALLPWVANAQVLEKVFDFGSLQTSGGGYLDIYPAGELILGSDGLLYGMTQGETDNAGTIYKVTTSGAVTTLVGFPELDSSDWEDVVAMGCSLRGALVRGGDGNFYGTASQGGESDCGTVFRVTPAGDFTKLADFSGSEGDARGRSPEAELAAGMDGHFYGTTRSGGLHGHGVVFKISPSGTVNTLVDFTGTTGGARGSTLLAGLIQAPDGNFYGVTLYGGASDLGTVFRVSPSGVFSTLVDFTGQGGEFKGARPWGRLALGADGKLYGTTSEGGGGDFGTIFRITTNGSFETLAEFTGGGGPTPGAGPSEALLLAPDGNFYGTAGNIFKMTPSGQILFSVDVDAFGGQSPSSLVYGGDGNLYGVGLAGEDFGTIFRMTPDGVGTKIAQADSGFVRTGELAALVEGSDGLYGTTEWGGRFDRGTIYRLKPSGEFTTVVEFSDEEGEGDARGANPNTLVKDSVGDLYGTTEWGAPSGGGTVFRMVPNGGIETIYSFEEVGTNDRNPRSLMADPDGSLYGTTGNFIAHGSVFRLTKAGQLTRLATFTGTGGATPGRLPNRLLRASDGNFYGTTREGGLRDHGTVFKMTPGGAVTVLHQFDGTSGNYTSTIPWQNVPIKTQTGQFSISFRVQPNAALMDGVTGLCFGPAGDYSDIACAVRINSLGKFDARNGNDYAADTNFPYVPGTSYRVTMVVNLATKKYSVTVNDTPIASNFSFRTQQATVSTLDHLALRNESSLHPGDHTVTEISLKVSGKYPQAGLVQGSDGVLYGTTSRDGLANHGTYFRITTAGSFKELSDLDVSSDGVSTGQLHVGPDGNMYGTTGWSGGAFGEGSLFRAHVNGSISTIASFPNFQLGGPGDPLVFTTDGTMYGTFQGDEGGIYRVMSAGKPVIYEIGQGLVAVSGTLLMQGKFSARGALTTIHVDYGESMPNLPPDAPFPNTKVVGLIDGYLATISGTTLTGLTPGRTYRYQYRAVNSQGTAESEEGTFVSTGPPIVALLEDPDVDAESALVRGTVDAGNSATIAVFEYGETSNSFPESKHGGTVPGSGPEGVSATLEGLEPGKTYYYRLRATNALGIAVSGTQSFTTLAAPEVRVTGATALSSTRVELAGMVNAKGTEVEVYFEYRLKREDETPWSAPQRAEPQTVSASEEVEVTKVLTGLVQGETYEYRVVAEGDGGDDTSEPGTFTLSLLSGLLTRYPDAPGGTNGALTINFNPPATGAWRFRGETAWRVSGEAASRLAGGLRVIEFLAIPGFAALPAETVEVIGGESQVIERSYTANGGGGTGNLTVRFDPDSLVGAQWRFLNETVWRNSTVVPLVVAAGSHRIESKPLGTHVSPPVRTVVVAAGQLVEEVLPYEENFTGLTPVTFAAVSANESLPYAYLGQIRSRAGTSTGFAVKRRVVATAAHVVFDDTTLSYIPELQWLHQRHAGEHEPLPQVPRGYYLLAGYADERIATPTPGMGTPKSQHLDGAALFFSQDAARGGYGGYLASEKGDSNEFLGEDSEGVDKFLAGYAEEGVALADRGKLHVSSPFTAALGAAFGEAWVTGAVRGTGGCSGGPLFVRHGNQGFFPAAIYLGGEGQAVVRAIDKEMVNLFLRAETSGNGGGNNTSGGITLTTVTTVGSSTLPATINVLIEPTSVRAKARWKLHYPSGSTSSKREHNEPVSVTSTGLLVLELTPVSGFEPPQPLQIQVTGGTSRTYTYTYGSTTALEAWRRTHFQTIENLGPAADSADPDGDGWDNFSEYTANTNPKNASDKLKVNSAGRTGNTFTMTTVAKTGRRYVLERSISLDGDEWSVVDTEGPLSVEGPIVLTDSAAPPERAFYRIHVSLPP